MNGTAGECVLEQSKQHRALLPSPFGSRRLPDRPSHDWPPAPRLCGPRCPRLDPRWAGHQLQQGEYRIFAWLLPRCAAAAQDGSKEGEELNVSRPRARLPALSTPASILFNSRDFDDMSVQRRQSTKLHWKPPAGREEAHKKCQPEDRPPALNHDTPHANQPAAFFSPPPLHLPARLRPCYIAREKSPHPLARPRPQGAVYRLVYLHTQLPLRDLTTNQARNEAFAAPSWVPLLRRAAIPSVPPQTLLRHPSQISQSSRTPPTAQASARTPLPSAGSAEEPDISVGGEGGRTAGWTAEGGRTGPKTPSGIVPRCLGCAIRSRARWGFSLARPLPVMAVRAVSPLSRATPTRPLAALTRRQQNGGRSALSTSFSQHLGGNEAVKGKSTRVWSPRISTSL
ncbi:hypothetical protein QBC39DRAFT_360291 [Podospora conica]|nr:hypothetical protein QBC39DRAFT_360291 [Schizothecium conicum]